jgi:Arc/MetJ-type ribon-helix-helix transcriptional regulator
MTRRIIVELDEGTARELERIAPSRARKRSEFVRRALRRALDAEVERRIARAYRQLPDDVRPDRIDPKAWEPRRPTRRGRQRDR